MGAPPTPLTPGQPAPLAPGEFVGASRPQVASFLFKNVTPPSLLYIQRDDQLAAAVLSSIATETVNIAARLLLVETGEIKSVEFQVRPGTAYTQVSGQNVLAEGYLLSVACSGVAATIPGQTYVTLFINRGRVIAPPNGVSAVLFAGYVTALQPGGWPGGGIQRVTDGTGASRVVSVANPAAGADWNTGPALNQAWQLISLQAQLVTAAAVANRNIQLLLTDGGNTMYTGMAASSVVAGSTVQVTGAPGQNTSTLIATNLYIPFPPNTFLFGTNKVRTVTVNIQAADQWSLIFLYVREWLSF